jgi:hypothetical protein
LRWNGRQIRNAFQTVLALADFHYKKGGTELTKPVVLKKHFEIVANASIQFDKYLATHGADEDKGTGREYMGAQNYSPSPNLVFKGLSQDDSDSSSEEHCSNDRRRIVFLMALMNQTGQGGKMLARERRERNRGPDARGARRNLTKTGNQERSTKRRRRKGKRRMGRGTLVDCIMGFWVALYSVHVLVITDTRYD